MKEVIHIWSYYGRKSKVIQYYPKPIHNIIIEPFAGTAVYSLHNDNWKRDIILIEKYDLIVRLWRYLQQAKPEDILKLPDMYKGDVVPEFLCEEERWLIGFNINQGSASPKKTAQKFNGWNRTKKKIANDLYKIKHWDIRCDTYESIENIEATWYIDPPYQFGGKYYKYNKIDYCLLSKWCKERKGQVIVCENTKANWLNFSSLVKTKGQLHKTTEAIWYKNDNVTEEQVQFSNIK